MQNLKIHKLKNGFTIAFLHKPEATNTSIFLATRTGSVNETKDINGASHFLEHMLFKGTKTRKGFQTIPLEFDTLGSQSNAYTSEEHTAFYAKSLPQNALQTLEIIADMFLNATIPNKDLERERGPIIEEINMYEDMPMQLAPETFQSLLFGSNSPLGQSILGPKKNIKTISAQTLRKYKKNNYCADNSILVVTGNFNQKEILNFTKETFKNLKSKQAYLKNEPNFNKKKFKLKNKKTDQAHIVLGVPAFSFNNNNEYALYLLDTILGAGMSSRLFVEIREKRSLAYYVMSHTEQFTNSGYFCVNAGVSLNNINPSIKIIKNEFKKLQEKEVSEKELEKAKNILLSSFAFGLENNFAKSRFIATSFLLRNKKPITLENFSKNIQKITPEDIKNLAEKLFNESNIYTAIVAPKDKI